MVAAFLDLEGEHVKVVVVLDHRLGGGHVATEEHLGGARDGLGHHGGEADHLGLHLIELLVERGMAFGHGFIVAARKPVRAVHRTSTARWAESPLIR